jgi:hypothetical protein
LPKTCSPYVLRVISRSAQFNLFLHPNKNLTCLRLSEMNFHSLSGTVVAGSHYQRACFEGTKKPIGWFTSIDRLSLAPPHVASTGAS